MIRVENLTKSFNRLTALDGVSLHVKRGESFALLGPNGAGKTTLVRILSTLLRPTSGTVAIDGIDILEDPVEAKKRIGVVSHNPFLYDELTALENLRFYGELYDCEPEITALLKEVNLEDRARDLVGTYSRGMKQRLSIARALLHDPPILILDEPTSGLDMTSRKDFYRLLQQLKSRGKTFLLTTHYMEEAKELCTRGVLLNKGRVVSELDLTRPEEELEGIFAGLEG
ncbi:MAG: heme ABC exporter ATP-binding protein CcmA [Methanobacteriota archaeon]|nr:MAG: heme ABC exporter ATP-binding protein CcmA [Euryarchaeota archaeon]